MWKLIPIAIVAVIFLFFAGCSSVKVGPGEEAVLLKQPMLFGHGGVVDEPVKTGRTFVALTTSHTIVDMKPQQGTVSFEDLMSSDGVPLHFDAVVRVQVTDSVRLIRDFGEKWWSNNFEAEVRNRVRQAVRKHGMNETAISSTAIDQIDAEVTAALVKYIKDSRLPIQLIKFTVGKANPPDLVKNQRVNTAREQQRQQTEVQTQLAEVARLEAEKARAAADNAYRAEMGLSAEQFVQIRAIQAYEKVCGRRDSKCTVIQGGGTPLVQVR